MTRKIMPAPFGFTPEQREWYESLVPEVPEEATDELLHEFGCADKEEDLLLKAESEDARIGVNIIKRALEEPFRQIVLNAGREASVLLNSVKKKGGNWGYDVRSSSDEPVDMIKEGIIDPAKVTKQALQNASSIAGLMLTTEALVSEIKEDEKQSAAGPGGPGGMGGMY